MKPTIVFDPDTRTSYVRFHGRTITLRGASPEKAAAFAADLAKRSDSRGLMYSAPADATVTRPSH